MPVEVSPGQNGVVTVTITGLNRGLDSQSSPTNTAPNSTPDIQNMTTNGGYPSGMLGSTLHIAGFVAPDAAAPQMVARYVPSAGTAAYILICQNGIAYKSTDGGATWTAIRSGLTTGASTWWSYKQIGDYLLCGNGTDLIYKYDGTVFIPLGAKWVTGAESADAALWTGETVDTTNYRQGLASVYCQSAGAQTSLVYTPATAYNAVTGLLAADDYETDNSPGTDYYHFKALFTNTGTIDTTLTRFLLTDGAGDTLNFPYTAWDSDLDGTAMPSPPVVGTWYDVYCKGADGTEAGTFDASSIATFTFSVDTSAGTLRMNIDDVYVCYATRIPPCQIVSAWKNMAVGATGSDFHFSATGAPDQYDTEDTSVVVVDENDGTEITGLHPYADKMLIAKDNSIHILDCQFRNLLYPDYDLTVNRVTTEHGCSSHRSMVELAGKVLMWWRNNIYAYSGIGTSKISELVDATLEDIEPTRLQYVVGGRLHDNNQVYWWWTPDGGTENTNAIAYNALHNAWLPLVGTEAALAESVYESDVAYLLTADYDGRILRQNSGTTWDGDTITRFIATPWLSAGKPFPVVSWRKIVVNYDTQTSGDLIVEARVADHPREFAAATYSTIATIDMSAVEEWGGVTHHLRAPWVQYRFRTVGAQVSLYWPIVVTGQALWRRP